MVYESDFYTTRRPYRYTPSYSTYTVSTVPSRQVRVLPGLGKVHIIHSYDRIVPYVGHKRLTVVTTPPKVYSTKPSVLQREYDWIERKVRPWVAYSATNNYLNSNSAVRIIFNRYPGVWNDSYSSSSIYRKYGTISHYSSSSSQLPCYEYWPYYSSFRNWNYPSFYKPYYKCLRYYSSSLPLYRSYLDTWFDRYIDWCYNYWPRYRSTYSSNLDYISPSKMRSSFWYWPMYYPRRMVYVRSPMTGLYYSNYLPISDYNNYYRIYRPLYSYDYWPYSSLNYLSSWWPRYRNYLHDDLSYRSLRMQRIFDDETRLIRAQAASLLKSVHLPVPRHRSYPITSLNRYGEYPARLSNDHYIHRLMQISPKNSKVEFMTYYTEPVKKYIGQGRLACVSYIGDRGAYGRRRNVYVYEDPVKNDIQLLSFYINKFREEKQQKQSIEPAKVPLSPSRPSRRFYVGKDETPQEIRELREARAARLAKINAEDKLSVEDDALKARKQREEARLAEEKALAEEQAVHEAKEAKEKKEKAAREASERAAELERQAELLRQEEIAKLAEIEKARKEEEEKLRAEEQKRLAEEARIEEERKQLLRLEEIARQAEEEREAELARQAEELAELARQEAELAEQAKQEAEAAELARQEEELAELRRQEEELAELERQERELEEAAEKAKLGAELACQENDQTDLEIETAEVQSDVPEGVQEDIEAKEGTEEPQQELELEEESIEEAMNEEPELLEQEIDVNVQENEPQEVEDDEPIAEAEDVPIAQGDTADEAEEEEEE